MENIREFYKQLKAVRGRVGLGWCCKCGGGRYIMDFEYQFVDVDGGPYVRVRCNQCNYGHQFCPLDHPGDDVKDLPRSAGPRWWNLPGTTSPGPE